MLRRPSPSLRCPPSPESEDLRSTLEQVPKFSDLPATAPRNNFRQHANNKSDELHRTWSETILHLLRLQAAAIGQLELVEQAELADTLVLLQKTWQLQAELYHKVTDHRREQSIQGSTQNQETDYLFGKEEIATAKLTQRINQGVRYAAVFTFPRKPFRFRTHRRAGPFRGSAKSFGSQVGLRKDPM